MTDEGQPINRQLVFTPKEAAFSKPPLAFPLGGKAASACEPIEVNLNFNLMSRLPLGAGFAALSLPLGGKVARLCLDG